MKKRNMLYVGIMAGLVVWNVILLITSWDTTSPFLKILTAALTGFWSWRLWKTWRQGRPQR